MGVTDIAEEMGWTNSKVSLYAQRGKFPKPVGEIGNRPVWLRDEIEPYLQELK